MKEHGEKGEHACTMAIKINFADGTSRIREV